MLRVDLHAKVWVVLNLHFEGKKHATFLGRHTTLAIIENRLSCGRRSKGESPGTILIPPPNPRWIPSPHDGEVGRGSRRGDFKRARQFDGTSPSPQPICELGTAFPEAKQE